MPTTPQPTPDAEPSIVLNKFSGLVNTVSRERLDANELASAINVDVDDRDQLHRRRGYTKRLAGNCHSLFASNDRTVYGVVDGNLCIIRPNYSTVVLKSGLNSDPSAGLDPLCYQEVGSTIYYSSVTDSGKITDYTVYPWGAQIDGGTWVSPVVIPTPTLAPIAGRLLSKPPMATAMTYFNGRLYMACGRQLWATELYLYDYVDKTKNFFQFEADITMVGAVTDGIYVGTDEGLWFLQGPAFPLKRTRIMDSAVIRGSMVDIPAELANPPQVPADADTPVKISICFMTENGYCVAQDSGNATNFSEDKFIFPNMVRAAAFYRRQDGMNQYVVVCDSEGAPAHNSRIGEYLDPALVRAVDSQNPALEGMSCSEKWEATLAKLVPESAVMGEEYVATLVPAL